MLVEISNNWTSILALWGSVVSTILLFLTLREVWVDRFRLKADLAMFGGGPKRNVISITNLSKNRITIGGLDLFWSTNLRDENTHKDIGYTGYELECHIEIEAKSTKTLSFQEENYFKIRSDDGNLYMIRSYKGSFSQYPLRILGVSWNLVVREEGFFVSMNREK